MSQPAVYQMQEGATTGRTGGIRRGDGVIRIQKSGMPERVEPWRGQWPKGPCGWDCQVKAEILEE